MLPSDAFDPPVTKADILTATSPDSIRCRAVEFTNRSGRPTSAMEAKATVIALCGSHRWAP